MARRSLLPLLLCAVLGSAASSGAGAGRQVVWAETSIAPPPQTRAPAAAPALDLKLPNKKDTLKFAVIGDNGTGEPDQYRIGEELAKWRAVYPFDMVIMLGDNMYGSQNP